jgi:hypothetical protein
MNHDLREFAMQSEGIPRCGRAILSYNENMHKTIQCQIHGEVGFGMACIHICQAIAGGQQVGFYCGEQDERLARPDAWCAACEETWFKTRKPRRRS